MCEARSEVFPFFPCSIFKCNVLARHLQESGKDPHSPAQPRTSQCLPLATYITEPPNMAQQRAAFPVAEDEGALSMGPLWGLFRDLETPHRMPGQVLAPLAVVCTCV